MLNLLHDNTTNLTGNEIITRTIPAIKRHTCALSDLKLEIGRNEENKRTHRLTVDGAEVRYTERFQTSPKKRNQAQSPVAAVNSD